MLEIRLFGATEVITGTGRVVSGDLGGAKPRQILEILAVSADATVSKEHLADLLWDGRPPRSYLGTLESYVCVLRRSLALPSGRGSAIRTVDHGYVLDGRSARVDLAEFRRLVRSAQHPGVPPATALQRVEDAVALVRGDLLADDAYPTWAAEERSVFRTELVAATTSAGGWALTLGDPATAIRLARLAVAHDALAEPAWRLLMQALGAAGTRPEALRAYFELRDRLVDGLGVQPSPETVQLYLEMLRADAPDREGAGVEAREEIRLLMSLMRQAVTSIPGLQEPGNDRALARVAADLAAAS